DGIRGGHVTGVQTCALPIYIGAQVAGRIEVFGKDPSDAKKLITWGSEVEEGTVLAQIDDSLYKADMLSAKADKKRAEADFLVKSAQFEQAKKDWARAQALKGSGISEAEWDAAKATFEITQASKEVSSAQIDQAAAAVKK